MFSKWTRCTYQVCAPSSRYSNCFIVCIMLSYWLLNLVWNPYYTPCGRCTAAVFSRGSINSQWINPLGTSKWNPYTLCGKWNQNVVQRVCDFQKELLSIPIHLKITLPLWNAYGKFSTGVYDFTWNSLFLWSTKCVTFQVTCSKPFFNSVFILDFTIGRYSHKQTPPPQKKTHTHTNQNKNKNKKPTHQCNEPFQTIFCNLVAF